MYKRYVFKIILPLTLAIFWARAFLYAADVVDRIVAVVNDDIITQSELEESMLPFIADYRLRYGEEEFMDKVDEARQDALNRLIEEKLILQEAKRRKITVDEQEIEERLEHIKSRFNSEEEFRQMLEDSGITMAKLKQRYKEQIMMRKLVNGLVNARVNISPTQIAAYYYAHQEDFSTPKVVRFKVLLLKPLPDRNIEQTEELALQILDRIKAGEDFDMLVGQYSQGPNINEGGDMGYMPEGGIIKELENAISQLEPGGISALIKTAAGFDIIKLTDRKEAGVKSLTEVTDAIRSRLFQREAELTLREFVNGLKKDAYIKI